MATIVKRFWDLTALNINKMEINVNCCILRLHYSRFPEECIILRLTHSPEFTLINYQTLRPNDFTRFLNSCERKNPARTSSREPPFESISSQ